MKSNLKLKLCMFFYILDYSSYIINQFRIVNTFLKLYWTVVLNVVLHADI